MPRVFDKNNVILLRIDESDLNSFLIDMDIDDDGISRYMLEEFAKVVMDVIPEYVFAHYENEEINFLPEDLSEDEVLNYIIKNKSSIMKILTPYEQERLSACIL